MAPKKASNAATPAASAPQTAAAGQAPRATKVTVNPVRSCNAVTAVACERVRCRRAMTSPCSRADRVIRVRFLPLFFFSFLLKL